MKRSASAVLVLERSTLSARIGWKSLERICRSLATMLESGIDVRKAFEIAARRSGDSSGSRALQSISQAISRGEDVASAMKAEHPAFPELMVDMVSVAEQTGNLPEILLGLADHYDNNLRLRKAFVGQIAWPVIQFTAAVFIIAGLMLVLGWVAETRNNAPVDVLGLGLIGARGAMLWLSTVALFAFLITMGVLVLKRSLAARQVADPILLQVPVLGSCLRAFAIARFSWAFYLTQQSGMPIQRSLASSLKATANGAFINGISGITNRVKSGDSLGDALESSRLFPEEYIETVHVAESAGTVPEALHRLSPQFEDQARRSLSMLTSALAWGIWAMVAAFIVFLIFRIFSWYVGLIDEAARGL